jgi:hypothetical protein
MIEPPRKPVTDPAVPARSGEGAPQPPTSADRDTKVEPRKPEDDKRIERFPER